MDLRIEKIFRFAEPQQVSLAFEGFNIFSSDNSAATTGSFPPCPPYNPNFGKPSAARRWAGGCSSASATRSRRGEIGRLCLGRKALRAAVHSFMRQTRLAAGRERLRARLPRSSRRPFPSGRTQARSDVERRIDALLSQMTLEEKLGQLQQLDGHADGRFRDEHLELARKGLLGSTLNVRGAAQVNALQRRRWRDRGSRSR